MALEREHSRFNHHASAPLLPGNQGRINVVKHILGAPALFIFGLRVVQLISFDGHISELGLLLRQHVLDHIRLADHILVSAGKVEDAAAFLPLFTKLGNREDLVGLIAGH